MVLLLGMLNPLRGSGKVIIWAHTYFYRVERGFPRYSDKKKNRGTIKGVKASQAGPGVSHLFFVDDSLILCDACEMQGWELKRILATYERATCQQINFEKSTLFFSPNTSQNDREELLTILGVNEVSCHEKYLEIPTKLK